MMNSRPAFADSPSTLNFERASVSRTLAERADPGTVACILRVISQMTFGSVNAASTVGFSLTLGPGPPVPPCDPSAPLPHSPNLL
jgi:hypothetical protein